MKFIQGTVSRVFGPFYAFFSSSGRLFDVTFLSGYSDLNS
jgi:hypothetical protein